MMSMSPPKRPFSVNEIVNARLSFPPSVTAGDHYVVRSVRPAKCYSGWMVAVARVGRRRTQPKVIATLDAGYFGKPVLVDGQR